MHNQSLNGIWQRRIGSGEYAPCRVPYSTLPVGRSTVRRSFDRAEASQRSFLVFEGITYRAEVTLNGKHLGDMLPYARYRFEITDVIRKNGNELSVEIEDINVAFGPSEGWENYGGIIREVYIEYRGAGVITETAWVARLNDTYDRADCSISAKIDAPENARIDYILTDANGHIVHSSENPVFAVNAPVLWSPSMPYLYTLRTRLTIDGALSDERIERVGFKEFAARGRRFHLNGKPLFLAGVCRHDLYGDSGHTASYDEMRRDMELIKSAGVNFVRLVHYPHDPRIIDIADEIGLLISEEPGLWWSDMKNPEICEGSLEVLRRTVLRDRNHPSIAFWLSFNECIFTPEYLMDAARVCRENDPWHMISGANCMSIEMTKELFPKCSMDFYTMHPYAPTTELMKTCLDALGTGDRPLMFTEWGGYFVHENPNLLETFINFLCEYWQHGDDQPIIAGACLWMWAEMFEFSRAEPACADGILHESLVDRYRNPGPNFEVFRRAFARIDQHPPVEYRSEQAALIINAQNSRPVDLSTINSPDAWTEMIEEARKPIGKFYYKFKRERRIEAGPIIMEDTGMLAGLRTKLATKPIVIPCGNSVCIPVNAAAREVYFIGNVSMPKGYPIGGSYGEVVGGYTVRYADGTSQQRILKNGDDITTATGVFGPSRIDPRAANAPRVLRFSYDYDREQYNINLLRLKTDSRSPITDISVWVAQEGYYLLLYGITLAD